MRVIEVMYGSAQGGSCTTNVMLCPYGVGLRKFIRRGWTVIPMPLFNSP